MPGGVAGARPVKAVPYADACNLSLSALTRVELWALLFDLMAGKLVASSGEVREGMSNLDPP